MPVTTLVAHARHHHRRSRQKRAAALAAAALGLATTLGACSAGAPELTAVAASPQSPAAVGVTSGEPAAFDPFAREGRDVGGPRAVIASPTLQQVLEPGPIEEITVGQATAPVVLVKYISPTCPFCRQWQAQVWPQFKRAYVDTGKVRLIVREFPIGFQSGAATVAMRCLPRAKRFAGYEVLLKEQARWVSQEVRREPIFEVLRPFGLDRATFEACYENRELIDGLKQVKERGRDLGIIGTPNFFINDKLEKRVLNFDQLREAIDPILAGSGRSPHETALRP
ncbi:MAG: DsbA family protein [Hyphomicrobiaceae bacterium]